MFGYMTFNVKYYILSQIFYKKIGWLFGPSIMEQLKTCQKYAWKPLQQANAKKTKSVVSPALNSLLSFNEIGPET